MGGVCLDPEGQYFVWKSHFSLATKARLLSLSNPTIYVTINYLEIGSLSMQLLIFAPRMVPLDHIYTYINNPAS